MMDPELIIRDFHSQNIELTPVTDIEGSTSECADANQRLKHVACCHIHVTSFQTLVRLNDLVQLSPRLGPTHIAP